MKFRKPLAMLSLPPIRKKGDFPIVSVDRPMNLSWRNPPKTYGRPFLPYIKSAPTIVWRYSATWSKNRRIEIISKLREKIIAKHGLNVWDKYRYDIEEYANMLINEAETVPPSTEGYCGEPCRSGDASSVFKLWPEDMRRMVCIHWMCDIDEFTNDVLRIIEWAIILDNGSGKSTTETINKTILMAIPIGIIGMGLIATFFVAIKK